MKIIRILLVTLFFIYLSIIHGISQNLFLEKYNYDSIYHPRGKNYSFALKDSLWGVISPNGKTIIPCQYQYIDITWYNNYNGIDTFIVQKGNKLGTIDFKNNMVIPFEYEEISNWVEYGPDAHYVVKGNKIGLIEYSGKIIIPIIYDSLHYYFGGLIKGKLNGKYGVLNYSNEIVLPFIYDALIVDFDYFGWNLDKDHKNKIAVRLGSAWHYLNYNGEFISKNVPIEVITKEFAPFEINNYDFEYIKYCMIKTK